MLGFRNLELLLGFFLDLRLHQVEDELRVCLLLFGQVDHCGARILLLLRWLRLLRGLLLFVNVSALSTLFALVL